MFDIKKFIEVCEAKKDPFFTLAMKLKRNDAVEPFSRKYLRKINGYKACGRVERCKLIKRLKRNNIVIIGDLTLNQNDIVHLVYKHSRVYHKWKRREEAVS